MNAGRLELAQYIFVFALLISLQITVYVLAKVLPRAQECLGEGKTLHFEFESKWRPFVE